MRSDTVFELNNIDSMYLKQILKCQLADRTLFPYISEGGERFYDPSIVRTTRDYSTSETVRVHLCDSSEVDGFGDLVQGMEINNPLHSANARETEAEPYGNMKYTGSVLREITQYILLHSIFLRKRVFNLFNEPMRVHLQNKATRSMERHHDELSNEIQEKIYKSSLTHLYNSVIDALLLYIEELLKLPTTTIISQFHQAIFYERNDSRTSLELFLPEQGFIVIDEIPRNLVTQQKNYAQGYTIKTPIKFRISQSNEIKITFECFYKGKILVDFHDHVPMVLRFEEPAIEYVPVRVELANYYVNSFSGVITQNEYSGTSPEFFNELRQSLLEETERKRKAEEECLRQVFAKAERLYQSEQAIKRVHPVFSSLTVGSAEGRRYCPAFSTRNPMGLSSTKKNEVFPEEAFNNKVEGLVEEYGFDTRKLPSLSLNRELRFRGDFLPSTTEYDRFTKQALSFNVSKGRTLFSEYEGKVYLVRLVFAGILRGGIEIDNPENTIRINSRELVVRDVYVWDKARCKWQHCRCDIFDPNLRRFYEVYDKLEQLWLAVSEQHNIEMWVSNGVFENGAVPGQIEKGRSTNPVDRLFKAIKAVVLQSVRGFVRLRYSTDDSNIIFLWMLNSGVSIFISREESDVPTSIFDEIPNAMSLLAKPYVILYGGQQIQPHLPRKNPMIQTFRKLIRTTKDNLNGEGDM